MTEPKGGDVNTTTYVDAGLWCNLSRGCPQREFCTWFPAFLLLCKDVMIVVNFHIRMMSLIARCKHQINIGMAISEDRTDPNRKGSMEWWKGVVDSQDIRT
jgi:hypothetical protein